MDGGTIDTLQIEIDAESAAAANKVTALINQLGRLKEAVKGFSTNNTQKQIKGLYEAIGSGNAGVPARVRRLTADLAELKAVIASFNGDATKAITEAISGIGNAMNAEAISNIKSFGDAIKNLSDIGNNGADLTALKDQISELRKAFGKNIKGATSAERFADAIKKITDSISTLNLVQTETQDFGHKQILGFTVGDNVDDSIKNVKDSVSELRYQTDDALSVMSKFVGMTEKMSDASSNLSMGGIGIVNRKGGASQPTMPEKPRLEPGFDADGSKMAKYQEEMRVWKEEMRAYNEALAKTSDTLDEVAEKEGKVVDNAGAMKSLADKLEKVEVTLGRIGNVLDATTDRYNALSESAKDSFESDRAEKFKDMIEDLRYSFESASNAANSMQMAIDKAISDPSTESTEEAQRQMKELSDMMFHLVNVSNQAKSAMGAADFERSGETGAGKLELEMLKAEVAIRATTNEIDRLKERLDVFRSESNIEIVGPGNIANMAKAVGNLEVNLGDAIEVYKNLVETSKEYTDNGTEITAKKAKELTSNLSSSISEMKALTSATTALFAPFKRVTVASRMLNETEFSRLETRFLRLDNIFTSAGKKLNTLNNRMTDLEYKKGFDPESESVQKATEAIDDYNEKIQDMKNVLDEISGKYSTVMEFRGEKNVTDEQANAVRDTYIEITQLADEYHRLGKVAEDAWMQADNAIKQARRETSQFKDDIRDATNDFGNIKDLAKSLEETAGKANGLGQSIKGIAAATFGLESAMGFLKRFKAGLGEAASKLQSALVGISQNALKAGFAKLTSMSRSAFKGVASAAKGFGQTVLNQVSRPFVDATEKVLKWRKALGRVMLYRALREAISMVTGAFKTGIENLYYYSQLVGTAFAPAMDKMATSALYLKNTFGAMAAPLLERLAPAIDLLVDKFVVLLNVIGKAMAVLTGKTVYTQAVKYATEYGDALDKAGGKAKKLKDYVLGIDELNIINDNPSTGGSGGLDADDYLNMFEEVEVGEEFDWAQRMKEAIENGDWAGAGQIFADKLNEIVSKWDTQQWGQLLGEKINDALNFAFAFMTTFDFSQIGEKLADAINGIFGPIDWDELGRLFASEWNALFDFIYGFATTLGWHQIGLDIAGAINGFLDELDARKAAQAVTEFVAGLFDTINTVIEETNWGVLGDKFAEFLNNVDWYKVISDVLTTITDSLAGLKEGIDAFLREWNWANTAHQVAKAINQAFSDVDWKGLGETLKRAFVAAFDFLRKAIAGIEWDKIGEDIADFVSGIKVGDIIDALTSLAKTVIDSLATAVKAFLDKLPEDILGKVTEILGFVVVGAIASLTSKKTELLVKGAAILVVLFTEFGDKIKELAGKLVTKINDFFGKTDWKSIGETISKGLENALDTLIILINDIRWDKIVRAIVDLLDGIDWVALASDVVEGLMALLGAACESVIALLINGVPEVVEIGVKLIGGILAGIIEASADFPRWLKDNVVDPFIDSVKASFGIDSSPASMSEIGTSLIKGLFSGIIEAITGLPAWLKEHFVDPFVDGVKYLFGIHSPSTVMAEIGGFLIEGLLKGITDVWSTITDFFSKGVDEIKTFFSEGWDSIKADASGKWENIKTDLSGKWDDIKSDATEKFTEIKTTVEQKWEEVKTDTQAKWDNIKTDLASKWDNIKADATDKFGKVKSTIQEKWQEVKSDTETKWSGVKSYLATKWDEIKANATTKFAQVKSTISTKWDEVKADASSKWSTIISTLRTKWDELKTAAVNKFDEIKTAISQKWNSIVQSARTWGSDMMDNISSGISSGINRVSMAVSGVADTVRGFLHFSEPDIGPLSDFHTYMPDMMELMAKGIRDNSDLVLNEIKRLSDSMSDSFEDLTYDIDVDVQPSGLEESLAEFDRKIQRTASLGMSSQYVSNYEGSAEDYSANQQEGNEAVVSALFTVASQIIEAINESGGATVTLDGKTLMNAVEKAQRQRGVNVFPGGVFG